MKYSVVQVHWKRYIFLVLMIGFGVQLVKGQSPNYIDSLKRELHQTSNSFKKAKVAYKIGCAYVNLDPQKGLNYLHQSLALFPKDSIVYLGDTYNVLAATYAQVYPDSMYLAIDYLNKSIKVYQQYLANKKSPLTQRGLAHSFLNLAHCYIVLKDYEEALQNLYQGAAIYEELNSSIDLRGVYRLLSVLNKEQKDYTNALVYAKKELALASNYTIEEMEFSHYGDVNYSIGSIYRELNQADSAIVYYNKALEVFQKTENKGRLVGVYNGLATVYRRTKELDLATKYINKAIELEEHIVYPEEKLDIIQVLGAIYYDRGAYEKSIQTYQQLLQKSTEAQDIKQMELAHRGLGENYAAIQNFEKAHGHVSKVILLQDSLLNRDRINEIKDLEVKYQTRYETQKKEQANNMLAKNLELQKLTLAQNRQQLYSLWILFILVGIISYLGVKQYQNRSKQQILQLRHRLLRNQMNPHFIFNALIAIQNFVYKNDPREAGKYLSSFAKLVRAILENSRSEYISLAKEIQWLQNYLKLQLLRFNNKFDFDIQIDDKLDLESVQIPPMLTQPFIENALEHGIKTVDYQGKLVVGFELKDNLLQVAVRDNGIGFSNNKTTEKEKHISLATTITKERLEFLNKKHKNKIHLEIEAIEPSGTLVSFTIPLHHKY